MQATPDLRDPHALISSAAFAAVRLSAQAGVDQESVHPRARQHVARVQTDTSHANLLILSYL